MPTVQDVTALLSAWGDGDQAALDQLVPLVYAELHELAHRHMRGERPGHPLQTTALVNEAYLRLVGLNRIHWQNRTQFFAIAAQAMRRILVDAARERDTRKRGGEASRVSVDEACIPGPDRDVNLAALDDALEALAKIDPRKSRVVELRYFGGMSIDETAEALHVSADTVGRDWRMAKLWLLRELQGSGTG